MSNPFEAFTKGVGSMLFANVPAEFKNTAPQWTELSTQLAAQQTELEKQLPKLFAEGKGPTSSTATLRLFDAPAGTEPSVTLWRDSASWCPYCELVWLQLEEKRIPYKVEFVPMRCYGSKPASFMAINPSGGIPVARINGRTMSESRDILAAIEAAFPSSNPLQPAAGSAEAAAAVPLLQLERQLFSVWFRWLTAGKSADASARAQYCALLDRVDEALRSSGGPYFLGEKFSMVDIMYTPFLERMAASLPYYKGLVVRDTAPDARWPALQAWFAAMDTRPTYARIKSDYYTHVHDLPPQIGGCVHVPGSEKYAAEIDGTGPKGWQLPLAADGLEPLGAAAAEPGAEAAAKREAAAKMVLNHESIVKFACRGAGTRGIPGVGAPLSDPNAVSNLKFAEPVDAALRHIVHALLQGTDAAAASGLSEGQPLEQLKPCLQYLRDRVGVPRDMAFPAARQLRAHINWYLQQVESAAASQKQALPAEL